jgi:hypothetical protein
VHVRIDAARYHVLPAGIEPLGGILGQRPGRREQHHRAVPDPDVGPEPAGRPHHGSTGHCEIEHLGSP